VGCADANCRTDLERQTVHTRTNFGTSNKIQTSFFLRLITFGAAIAQSVQRLATGWTDRGSNPGVERDFPHQSRLVLGPTQPPIQRVPGLSRGVKRPARGVVLLPHLAPMLKKE